MDLTKKIRAENVRFLIMDRCAGNKSEFARRIDSSVQHISKILRALDPDADQLKDTAKKYVGDDIAARIEIAFELKKGDLSLRNLGVPEQNEHELLSTTSAPMIKWSDIPLFLNNEQIPMTILNVPQGLSEEAFVTRLPQSIGNSIESLAAPGDIIAVEVNISSQELKNDDFVMATIVGSDDISCWKLKKVGLDLFLQNEEFPDRVYDGKWNLVGVIKFSIRGL